MNPDSRAGRLLIWPVISPENIRLSEPAHYVTWPGWEEYRMRRLGQNPPPSWLTPVYVNEPSGFIGSLTALLEAASDNSPALFESPMALALTSEESEGSLVKALRRGSAEPSQLADRPLRPAHLTLALWAVSEHYRLESDRLLSQALDGKRRLQAALTGTEPQDSDPIPYSASSLSRPQAITRAWLAVASPFLNPGDRLMAISEEFAGTLGQNYLETAPGSIIYSVTAESLPPALDKRLRPTPGN
ncbi:MAG: hypothetical protein LBT47_12100 [Deltaproteobacteria bacterium]|nr:hypothetical protein [Deltaproteobacteria bacterium]